MPAKRKSNPRSPSKPRSAKRSGGKKPAAVKMRVIGGHLGGRTVTYHGEAFTRPMRDAVRENLFNLIGPSIRGSIAIDLFAGTGALAIEAISRGAVSAVAVESDRRAADQVRDNVKVLGIERQLNVHVGDAFRLAETLLQAPADDTPWTVFLSPPYAMWIDDWSRTGGLIRRAMASAPPGSVVCVETDTKFDTDQLPGGPWDVRRYGLTVLSLHRPAMVCGMA